MVGAMMGYIVAALLFGGAYYVWHYNGTHTDSFLLIPLLDAIPSLTGDRAAQGEWSFRIVLGVAIFVLGLTVVTHARRLARRLSEPKE